ncbi:MAG: transketolase [Chloroflexi bacterium]|nr:transketolase [Chloroflexota bacterium]
MTKAPKPQDFDASDEQLTSELADRAVNTIRFLSADAVQKANSGHPGLPMGAADMAYVLWTQFLKHNPSNPQWFDRDRFVLSGGHGSMLLYSLLHLTGYDLSLEEIKRFRQWHSKTPGHPEYGDTPGVEITTGPLGQGAASSVGMALAEAMLAARYNRPGHAIINHFTYALVTDGDLMEGVASEAASLAGHLGLGKLIWLYDDNRISIDGSTDITFTEDRAMRFQAYGWEVLRVDGHDRLAIAHAIGQARGQTDRPTIIICRTHIGYGAPHKQDTAKAHGEPLGEEELRLAKINLGWDPDAYFYIPDDVLAFYRQALERGAGWEQEWEQKLAAYAELYPDEAAELRRVMNGELPADWEASLPVFAADVTEATRASSGKVINAIAPAIPELVGGSADLTGSNKTAITGAKDVQKGQFDGRYIRFGVREHGMGAILNGMALHGGFIPYGGTFLVFSDYMRPSIRLAALMGIRVIYVFSHDSIGLGEDGPTHQPVEHAASLRAMPNLWVVRPADGNETAQAWKLALERTSGPTAILLTRQGVPTLTTPEQAQGLQRGAYTLSEAEGELQVILVGTGSELQLAVAAQEMLAHEGVAARVVSMPCWEQFEAQPETYRREVFPEGVPVLAVEAGVSFGWERYANRVIGVNRFGASAPYKVIYEKFGLTAQAVADAARELL